MIIVSVPASPLPTVDVELGQERLLGSTRSFPRAFSRRLISASSTAQD